MPGTRMPAVSPRGAPERAQFLRRVVAFFALVAALFVAAAGALIASGADIDLSATRASLVIALGSLASSSRPRSLRYRDNTAGPWT